MSISLFSVLKMVPWGDVINKAPEIANGARKLWSAAARKPAASEVTAEALSLTSLQTQLAAAEAKLSDLHAQMLESTKLVEALADQNTQLLQRLEINRIRTLWLTGIVTVFSIVTMITLVVTLSR